MTSRELPETLRVLIVDDDRDNALTLAIMLRDQGISLIDSFTDPCISLESFEKGKYDLAILDTKMPVMDGFLLYERIRDIDPGVKVCFLTAGYESQYDNKIGLRFPEISTSRLLRKPISIDNLIEVISEIIHKS